jgi:hypothetical protein
VVSTAPEAPAFEAPAGVRRPGLRGWLMHGVDDRTAGHPGPHATVPEEHRRQSWWRVMCLTGVDYFSTLGYQPGIAALAAGLLSPLATIVLVALTLLGALPVYRRVAEESPHGQGSIAMLERLLSYWKGKLFVLVLLGFAATDFLITMTLSAADASTHLIENPHAPEALRGHEVLVTIALLAVLGAVFLRGFTDAIGIAVVLVVVYLALNLVVVTVGLWHVVTEPHLVSDWTSALTAEHGNPVMMVAIALVVFPKLALGMSGFETGVAVMPLAAVLLEVRDQTGVVPHIYFEWTEGNPVSQFLRFLFFGVGEVAPVTREVLSRAEPDRLRRPHVHVG